MGFRIQISFSTRQVTAVHLQQGATHISIGASRCRENTRWSSPSAEPMWSMVSRRHRGVTLSMWCQSRHRHLWECSVLWGFYAAGADFLWNRFGASRVAPKNHRLEIKIPQAGFSRSRSWLRPHQDGRAKEPARSNDQGENGWERGRGRQPACPPLWLARSANGGQRRWRLGQARGTQSCLLGIGLSECRWRSLRHRG